MAESEEELKSFLMKVKVESEKVDVKGLLKAGSFPSSPLAHTLLHSIAFCSPSLTEILLELFSFSFKLPLY